MIEENREAAERGDSGMVYSTLRKMGRRGQTKASDTTNLASEEFREHFKNISKDRFENTPEEIEATINRMTDISNTETARMWRENLEEVPSEEEITKQTSMMKNSAPGRDGVRLIYLVKAWPEIKDRLIEMIQYMFNHGADSWEEALKIGLVIPLHKKGD